MPTLYDRDRYARRAMDVRGLADAARDPDIKQALVEMAASYDKLVEEADRIARLKRQLDGEPMMISAHGDQHRH